MKTYITVIASALLLGFGGCSRTEQEDAGLQDQAIGFATSVTRAIVETGLGNGESFGVWAIKSRNGVSSNVFDGDAVTNTQGRWIYDDIRYWEPGATYDFHALYPHGACETALENNGGASYFVLRGFDARHSRDLMTAEQSGITHTEGAAMPVSFHFKHMLSHLSFTGSLAPSLGSVPVTIESARLYGMPASGDYNTDGAGKWELSAATGQNDPFASAGPLTVRAGETCNLFGDVLLFPQEVAAGYTLEITYHYGEGSDEPVTRSFDLSAASSEVGRWEAGRGYRYSCQLGSDNIIFGTPQIVPWGEAFGGNIGVE